MRLEVFDVTVRYGSRWVLRGASLGQICGGEILGVVGDNGSGKSTLLRALSGFLPHDAELDGSLLVDGQDVCNVHNRWLARRLGISLMPQDPGLVPTLSVLDNVFLGSEILRLRLFTNRSEQKTRLERQLDRLQWNINPEALPASLTVSEKQKVAILRSLFRRPAASLLLVDEPTTHLAPNDRQSLLTALKTLAQAEQAVSIVLVSHRPEDLISTCDRIAILSDGVIQDLVPSTDGAEAIRLRIFGADRHVAPDAAPHARLFPLALRELQFTSGKRILNSKRLTLPRSNGGVLGVHTMAEAAGEALFGLLSGSLPSSIAVDGQAELDDRPLVQYGPTALRYAGVGLVPARKTEVGLCVELTALENLLLTEGGRGLSQLRGYRERALAAAARFQVEDRLDSLVSSLSGGLKQRVLLAREFACGSRLLVVREPTQGLDGQSVGRLRDAISDARKSGALVVMLAADKKDLQLFTTEIRALT